MRRTPLHFASGSVTWSCLLLLVFPVLLFGTGCERRGVSPGDLAPKLALTDLHGEPTDLSVYLGKVVLLNFWAPWCAPCLEEMPALERLYQSLAGEGFAVVAVGMDDTPENVARFKQDNALSFPIVVDQTGMAKQRYRLSGLPESYLLDREGRVMMFFDAHSGVPTTRIVGPRPWDHPDIITQLRSLLSE